MSTQPTNATNDIQIYQADATIGEMKLWRAPDEVLAEAKRAADALQSVIQGSSIKPVPFGDREHLRHEHWETLGHFYGYCTKIESTSYVEFGEVSGYEATALLINERTGAVVGRVDSMCLDDEEQWGEVSAYKWEDTFNGKGEKVGRHQVQVGTKQKPLFQLRSMAQTRASAKAFRTKLAWVAVLAGYAPTPAEEMGKSSHPSTESSEPALPSKLERKKAPVSARPLTPAYPPPQAQAKQPEPVRSTPPANNGGPTAVISPAQARRFFALWREAGKKRERVYAYLLEAFGIDDDRLIPSSRYQEACKWAEVGR